MRNSEERFNFLAIGQAIKAARESKGLTREQAAEIIGIEGRHLMSIENQGQHPSLNVFWKLVKMFDISVDQYLFPDKPGVCRNGTHGSLVLSFVQCNHQHPPTLP